MMRRAAPGRPDIPLRPDVPPPPGPRHRRRRAWVAIAVAVVLVSAAGGWSLRAGDPPRDVAASPSPSVAGPSVTAPQASDGPYRFLGRTSDGGPLGWNPCRPIPYEVNLEYAPDRAMDTLDEAIDRVSEATGFTFEFLGTTRRGAVAAQRADYLDGNFDPLPVLVSWLPPARFKAIAPPARAAAVGIPRRGRGPDYPWYTSGQILVNTGAGAKPGFVARWDLGPLLLHEWGHVLGLAHVPDGRQIMWSDQVPNADPNPAPYLNEFGDGDLAGLARLATVPCEAP